MPTQTKSEIVIFKTTDNTVSVDVRFEGETVWLTQAQLVDLYSSSKANVSEHIKHIFEEGELEEDSVVRNFRTTAADGKSYQTKYYNLDMIISLGYRIKSKIATQFRQWRLSENLAKFKKNAPFGGYFDYHPLIADGKLFHNSHHFSKSRNIYRAPHIIR